MILFTFEYFHMMILKLKNCFTIMQMPYVIKQFNNYVIIVKL